MITRPLIQTSLALFCLCLLLLAPATGHSELFQHVNKYADISLTPERLHKIDRYRSLIDYYCGFAFVQPRHKVSPDFIRALILANPMPTPGPSPAKTPSDWVRSSPAPGSKPAVNSPEAPSIFTTSAGHDSKI